MWAVLEGAGTVRVSTRPIVAGAAEETTSEDTANSTPDSVTELVISHPGTYPLIEYGRHTAGVLELELDPGVRCHATCFTPGVAASQSE